MLMPCDVYADAAADARRSFGGKIDITTETRKKKTLLANAYTPANVCRSN
jgi:hypothetical protein